jgi:hypothetical protein
MLICAEHRGVGKQFYTLRRAVRLHQAQMLAVTSVRGVLVQAAREKF